tara:strand:- start:841 stop:1164 length:324 start_codon:yes stop_codon:yes gene_type:complete
MNEKFSYNKKYNNEDFIIWKQRWDNRLKLNNNTQEKYLKLMHATNPLVIPRNHKVEEALHAANNSDLTSLKKLISILEKPYEAKFIDNSYYLPSMNPGQEYQTFCGT